MKKFLKFVCTLLLIVAAFWLGSVTADIRALQNSVIRLHVVADSDSEEAQSIKLQVRDAVLNKLQDAVNSLPDMESAREYIQAQLPELERIANEVLEKAGQGCKAVVSFAKEAFPARKYDTFSLPSGIYESLRITIGNGEGKNWWCVVFPGLCFGATTEAFEDTAAGAGFGDSLTGALTDEPPYRARFFVMDCLGWIENLFYAG